MGWLPRAAKVYRALLFAYPAEFRHEYGAEMERLFEDRLQAEPRLRVWGQALADILLSAPREHAHILAADLRHAVRLFASAPSFTFVVIFALALGIGVNAAIFSLLNTVLLRSLPYGEAERLVYIWTPNARLPPPVPRELGPLVFDFLQWQTLTRSFSGLTAFTRTAFEMDGERVAGARVTRNFFQTLDVHPLLGRTIQSDDLAVAVISFALWQSHFAGSADVLTRSITLDKQVYRIIGVMAENFRYPRGNELPSADRDMKSANIWTPLIFTPKQRTVNDWDIDIAAIGRLRPGVSVNQAQAEMSGVMQHLDSLHPVSDLGIGHDWSALVVPVVETAVGEVRPQLWLMFGAVLLVLLIACANVANLLLVRAAGRGHEIGVRSVLGADRARLIRQLLTESSLLACGGGLLGVAVAWASVRLLVLLNPGNIPRLEQTSVDGRVLLFAICAALITGVLFGIVPALSLSRTDLTTVLKQGGNKGTVGSSRRWRRALVIAEVSLAVILAVGAGLLVRSYERLSTEGPGFTSNALSLLIFFDDSYRNHFDAERLLVNRLLQGVRALPGHPSAELASEVPLSHSGSAGFLHLDGDPADKTQTVNIRRTTSGYFAAMNIPLLDGRIFDDGDLKRETLVVNSAFAKKFWGKQTALGRRVQWGGKQWSTIVGVVGDIRHSRLDEAALPEAYFPLMGAGIDRSVYLIVRSGADPTRLLPSIRKIIRQLDPTLAADDAHTTGELISEAGARRKFQTTLLTAFAALALFLALLGIYSVIAYSVKQRTAEIGLRMALGAGRGDVVKMVLGEGMVLSLAGLILGLAAASALTRFLTSWLYAITPSDPVTFLSVAFLVLSVTITSCLLPVARAMRIDPASALRNE
jgi:putative ABC transport system permease protein